MAQFALSRFPSLRVTDNMVPLVRAAFFFSTPASDSFPSLHRPNPSPQSFPSLIEASPGYISRGRTSFHLHPTPSRCQGSSRDTTASLELYRATTVRHPELHTVSGSTPSSSLTLVSSPCSPLHPGAFLSRGNAVNHEITFSGDGAAARLAVVTVFWPEHRRRPIRSNPSRSF
jgi:hypothetical protein